MEYTAKDLERIILPKPGKVTIPFHKPDSLHPKTGESILKQAGLK